MSILTSKDLFGCITALVTPFDKDGNIDLCAWKKLLFLQIDAEVSAIVVAGTTGESAILNEEEFNVLLKVAISMCEGKKTKVIAQTGSISAPEVVKKNKQAVDLGADAVLVVTPYYLKTTQQGLFKHFTLIADNSSLPIILYNVPSRTQNDMLPATTKKLALHQNIIAIKEASLDENRVSDLAKILPKDFAILSGNDGTFLLSLTQGAHGVISVAGNLRPKALVNICKYYASGNIISAKKLNTSLEKLFKMLSCEPNPIPVKFILHEAGFIKPEIRLPLVWFDGEMTGLTKEIKHILEE